MAASKSASRKAAARKASKTRKRPPEGKKAAATRKKGVAAKKALATRKANAAATEAKTTARRPSEVPTAVAEIDGRMAIVRNNLRELVEQAAAYSGAANDELISQRIAEQEAKLELLKRQREELARRGS